MTLDYAKPRFCQIVERFYKILKFNCFFVDFLRSSFGRIKVKSTVVEREYIYQT